MASPPPPPPPMCLPTSQEPDEATKTHADYDVKQVHEMEVERLITKCYQWKCIRSAAVICVSRHVPHVPQSGPKCGLVALSMASSACSETTVETSRLLIMARDLGLSNHGEMFSVDFMLQLAQACVPHCAAQIISHQLADPSFVAEQLAAGNVLLVPYDSDRNFGPACLQGHKAHWAVLTGVIVPVDSLPTTSTGSAQYLNLAPSEHAVRTLQQYAASDVVVLALQGKSRHLSGWPLADLVASNSNLAQVDPAREAGQLKFVIPQGGITRGLQGRALLLKCSNVKSYEQV